MDGKFEKINNYYISNKGSFQELIDKNLSYPCFGENYFLLIKFKQHRHLSRKVLLCKSANFIGNSCFLGSNFRFFFCCIFLHAASVQIFALKWFRDTQIFILKNCRFFMHLLSHYLVSINNFYPQNNLCGFESQAAWS